MRLPLEARIGLGLLVVLQLVTSASGIALLHRMGSAGEDAADVALAGAWAMALVGVVSFALGLLVYRRMERRLLGTFVEVDAVLEAARRGDHLRRCLPATREAFDVQLAANLNWLLDRVEEGPELPANVRLRPVVLALLDELDGPVVVGRGSRVLAMNTAALATYRPPEGWRALAEALLAEGSGAEGWAIERLRGDVWRITQVEPASGSEPFAS